MDKVITIYDNIDPSKVTGEIHLSDKKEPKVGSDAKSSLQGRPVKHIDQDPTSDISKKIANGL